MIAGWIWVLMTVLAVSTSLAGEWPSWRGPNNDGTSPETDLVSSWSPEGENLIWKNDFIGRSTPVVTFGQACVIGRVGEGVDRQEIVACFDAETGSKRWEHRFNVYNTTVPFNRVGWASLVADPETGYIYAHGVAGQLICYNPIGEIVWSHFLAEDFGRLSGYGGRTQTPLIEGDQLILSYVSAGWGKHGPPRHRYFSFDKKTGVVNWISTPGNFPKDMNTQSVPVVAEIHGRRTLVTGNADGWVYALDANTGEKLWSFHLSRRGINSSPVVVGERVFISHSEENVDDSVMGRIVAIDATGKGDVTKTHEVWRINEVSFGFPSPTYHDGRLYHVDNSANLHAIDAKTGAIAWTHSVGTVGKGSPVYADGKLYVTETNGRFHILEIGKDGAKKLDEDELSVPDGRYAEIYGSPAIAYGRIYFTTEGGMYCLGKQGEGLRASGAVASRRKMTRVGSELASVLAIPADSTIKPGGTIEFWARTFDPRGAQALGAPKAEWKLEGLKGTIDDKGRFVAAKDVPFQAGEVVVKVGEFEGRARVRVIGDLPWSEDFDSYEVGKLPPHWIGAGGKYKVEEKDGKKVLTKYFRPKGLLRNALYMGPSTMSGYTVQADVMGGQKGRRKTDVGLINNGYTLDLMGNHQRIQVRTWPSEERIAQEIDFPWEMGKWYHMKLRVDVESSKAIVRGKVWESGKPEPEAWNITVEDPHPIQSGSPGILGYSPADAYYDNIKVTVND